MLKGNKDTLSRLNEAEALCAEKDAKIRDLVAKLRKMEDSRMAAETMRNQSLHILSKFKEVEEALATSQEAAKVADEQKTETTRVLVARLAAKDLELVAAAKAHELAVPKHDTAAASRAQFVTRFREKVRGLEASVRAKIAWLAKLEAENGVMKGNEKTIADQEARLKDLEAKLVQRGSELVSARERITLILVFT